MNTRSFPSNSLGALVNGPARSIPPIPIPRDFAARSALHAAREEQRLHRMRMVTGCVAGLGALAALAIAIAR